MAKGIFTHTGKTISCDTGRRISIEAQLPVNVRELENLEITSYHGLIVKSSGTCESGLEKRGDNIVLCATCSFEKTYRVSTP